ncbi:hypothetical protein [Desulfosarcina ovata]|uniref:Uncharacterized protein n=1 Tax=Desulfosarcina ovata subsp. ovata TaxID=2752305 RepID=A0A5K8AHZ3_9BACT|nr:hypothetical protein [Desulfosarcina ovata]BBO91480.1 hypothetical protein DSCOOX_46600 [Desulfosarcina ovata subsp. ovata]
MRISEWLNQKEKEGVDVSQIELPKDLAYDRDPDETVFFEEHNPCGVLCNKNHPFSKIERFGRWYVCKGQNKKAGIHSSEGKWRLITRDKEEALQMAKAHME